MDFAPFRVTVPATTANLGAGFDCLGLALSLRNEVEVRPGPGLSIQIDGEGADTLAKDETNLVWKTFRLLFDDAGEKPPAVDFHCLNRIPLARGLGSSAAIRTSALLAANEILQNRYSSAELLQIAAEGEGHPDNVAPAFYGGLVVCGRKDGETVAHRIVPKTGVRIVLLIPEKRLETEKARNALPDTVPLPDAVKNLQNTALTVLAFVTGQYDYLQSSLEDRLHQPYRRSLIPGFDEALAAAKEAGAWGAALSGAGPAIAAFTKNEETKIAKRMQEAFENAAGGKSRAAVLDVDMEGAKIEKIV